VLVWLEGWHWRCLLLTLLCRVQVLAAGAVPFQLGTEAEAEGACTRACSHPL
jgi:hypothetical protein